MQNTEIRKILRTCLVILFVFFYCPGCTQDEKKNPEKQHSGVPSGLVRTGPYSEDVQTSEQIGSHILTLTAKKLFFKKTKTLGFDNNLYKKIVVKELNITFFKDDKKVLVLYKDKQEMSPDMKSIQIDNPDIRYPKTDKKAKKVKIDRAQKTITFYYNDAKPDIWYLDNTGRKVPAIFPSAS